MKKNLTLLLLVFGLLASACSAAAPPSTQTVELRAISKAGDGADFFLEEEEAVSKSSIPSDGAQNVAYDEATSGGGEATELQAANERIILKNASMTLSVEDPASAMNAFIAMAEQMGGFVVSSNLYYYQIENGTEVPQASISMRVPAERLDEALTQIESGAGRVLNKSLGGQDVTREYTDLGSRLANLQEAENQLVIIMASATKTQDVLDVHNQLIFIREQIEVIQGQMKYFEQSAAFSVINLEIVADAAVQPLTVGGWEPVGVAKDAIQALVNSLTGIANAVIWLALYVLPNALVIILPLWAIWRGVRWLRARRRLPAPVPAE